MMNRGSYIEVLELIADLDAQRTYERDVPIADVPGELVCMWFDDLDVESGCGDLPPADVEVLEGFTAFYNARVDALPTSGGVDAFHACPGWIEITREAKKALGAMKRGSAR